MHGITYRMHVLNSLVFIELIARDRNESKYPSIVFLGIFYAPVICILHPLGAAE